MITRKIEFAFGGSFYDDPATLAWTDMSGLWMDDRTLTAKLGRDSNLAATPQAGTCRFRLIAIDGAGNPNGALTPGNSASPYFPNLVSGVPVRVTARDAAGTWWPVFYGLSESWNPTWIGNLLSWTVVEVLCSTAWTNLTQAGARRTYADRVVGDLAPARGESWEAGGTGGTQSYVMYVAGGVIYPGRPYITGGALWPDAYEPGVNFQRWGFAWLKLDNTGVKTWGTPGAGCPVVETGGADSSGLTVGSVLDGGFAGDRPGGQFVSAGGTSTISVAGSNFSRVQVLVGRPPTQLAPVGVSAPTSTTGWVASAGALTLVAATTLAHLPRMTAYDPTTKTTSAAAINGPVNAISWASPTGAQTLTFPNVPVVAGKTYCPSMVMSGNAATLSVSVQWLNNVGGLISTSINLPAPVIPFMYGFGVPGLLAPAGAVNAQVQVRYDGTGGAPTITVGCVGFYEVASGSGLSPGRWWPIGADAKIWAWVTWPDLSAAGMTTGTAGQTRWLHVAIDVTAWDDGGLHMIGWNGWPGVGGNPVVWADGARVSTGWSASYPGVNVGVDAAHTSTYSGSSMGGGFGSITGTPPTRVNTTNPSKLVVPAALLGAYQSEVTPDDISIGRAYSFFGGKKTLGTTYATDTGGQVTQALDQLGWPAVLRDISVGASNLTEAWTDLGSLSDYSALLGDLTKAEYGWVDIGADGHLRWLPRAWYGVGTAIAVAHYTWRSPPPGWASYVPPLDVRWDDKDVANSIVVSNGVDVMTRSRQDLTAQRRGLRKLVVTLPGGASQANIDAVADILAVVHAPGPRVESLLLRATSADDPMLAQILARKTGDVILVDLPQLPAPDLSVAMLITSIEHTSDGITWLAKLTLGVCPIPASLALWPDVALYPSLTLYPSGG